MDYAIYKTNNGKYARIIHRFTQEACNHRAKLAAQKKLDEMYHRAIQSHLYRNYKGTKDEFSYDYFTSVNTTERIRFFIAKL